MKMEDNTFTVQDLAYSNINGDAVPDIFVVQSPLETDDSSDPIDADAAGMDVPIIDMDLLLSSSSPEAEQELLKFYSALSSWGCFQAINHGIELALLDQVRQITRQFFAMPSEEKLKYLRADHDIEGYGTDVILSDQQVIDWNDRLVLSVYPENSWKLNYWPQEHKNFSKTLHEYTLRMKSLVDFLLKAMARSLNLETNPFLEQYGEDQGTMKARFNLYPRCPRPDLVHGLKPHCDGSAITILLQDREVEGLQFLKDGKWVMVPIIPHALLIIVGGQLEIMSNGVFKSPLHRALTSSQHERISVVMLSNPHSDREIWPADELIDKSRPALYRKIKNYPKINFHYHQQGKNALDALKI